MARADGCSGVLLSAWELIGGVTDGALDAHTPYAVNALLNTKLRVIELERKIQGERGIGRPHSAPRAAAGGKEQEMGLDERIRRLELALGLSETKSIDDLPLLLATFSEAEMAQARRDLVEWERGRFGVGYEPELISGQMQPGLTTKVYIGIDPERV